jgi:group I intron endonuclease
MTPDKETWILYQTTNLVNGKIYVGVHKLTDTNRSKLYLGSGLALKSAKEKYGRKNFTRITLAEFSCGEEAYKAEYQMVDEDFIKRPDTYNISLGGSGAVHLTADMRNKISIANTGKKASLETRNKISMAAKGKKLSEEHKAAIIAANKGNKHTLGRKLTDEHKAKISTGGKGRVFTDEHRARISAGLVGTKNALGRIMSEEHKNKLVSSTYKPVMIDGKYYKSIDNASKTKEVTYKTVFYRVKSNNPKWVEWRLATESEKLVHASGEVQ